jgi:ankyrin repeat protein
MSLKMAKKQSFLQFSKPNLNLAVQKGKSALHFAPELGQENAIAALLKKVAEIQNETGDIKVFIDFMKHLFILVQSQIQKSQLIFLSRSKLF